MNGDRQLTLTFVDRVEKKIQSPDREHVSPTGQPQVSASTSKQDDQQGADTLQKSLNFEGQNSESENPTGETNTIGSEEFNESFLDRKEFKLHQEPFETLSPSKEQAETQYTQNEHSHEVMILNESLEDSMAGKQDDKSLSDYYSRGFNTFSMNFVNPDGIQNDNNDQKEEEEKVYEIKSTTSIMLFQERNLFEDDDKDSNEDSENLLVNYPSDDLDLTGVHTWRSETMAAKQQTEVKAIQPVCDDLPEVEIFPAVSVWGAASSEDSSRTYEPKDSKDSKNLFKAENVASLSMNSDEKSIPVEEKLSVQESIDSISGTDAVDSGNQEGVAANDNEIFNFTNAKYPVQESCGIKADDPQIMVTPATPRTPPTKNTLLNANKLSLESPNVFSKPAESHIVTKDGKKRELICEEDDENVIIHFESELNATQESKEEVNKVAAPVEETMSVESVPLQQTLQSSVQEPAPIKYIEVERKFRITSDSIEKLTKLGASLLYEKTFTDTYYDDNKYSLTLSDCWLRQRNQNWEMKISNSDSQTSLATQYKELTSEDDIKEFLASHFDLKKSDISLTDLVKEQGLCEFATFTTTRQSYNFAQCTVDLDITNFGFKVGEIEVMVASESRIPAALDTIEDVAKKLGFQSLTLLQ